MFHRVWWTSAHSYEYRMPEPRPFPSKEDGYFPVQSRNLPIWRAGPPESLAHVNLERGIGTIDWYTGVLYPNHAVPKYYVERDGSYSLNPAYRGECYWLETGEELTCQLSSHRIAARTGASRPGTLVVNQNFHADWRSMDGAPRSHDGLLAIHVPAGRESVELTYRSTAFITGLWISAAGMSLLLALYAFQRRSAIHWAASSNPLKRRAARLVGWLVV
jgi:hypothetical protein